MRFPYHIVLGKINPAILSADLWVLKFLNDIPDVWKSCAVAEDSETGDVLKISIDFDILNLFADPIDIISRSRQCCIAEVQVRCFFCFYAIDTILEILSDCLSVYFLTETEHLQVPRLDEVRVYHKADLGRELEEDGKMVLIPVRCGHLPVIAFNTLPGLLGWWRRHCLLVR